MSKEKAIASQGAEPVYQVAILLEKHTPVLEWYNVKKDQYDTSMPHLRRIVYTAPPAAAPEDHGLWKCPICGNGEKFDHRGCNAFVESEMDRFKNWCLKTWGAEPLDIGVPFGNQRTQDRFEAWMARANAAPAAQADDVTREQIQLGVVEFHTARNSALVDQFYMVTKDLTDAACIVDIWLMDIAAVLKKHGYSMEIYRAANAAQKGKS